MFAPLFLPVHLKGMHGTWNRSDGSFLPRTVELILVPQPIFVFLHFAPLLYLLSQILVSAFPVPHDLLLDYSVDAYYYNGVLDRKYYLLIKKLRDEEKLSWRDCADYMKKNRKVSLSWSHLRRAFLAIERELAGKG